MAVGLPIMLPLVCRITATGDCSPGEAGPSRGQWLNENGWWYTSSESSGQPIRPARCCFDDWADLMLEGALTGEHHRHLRVGFVAGLDRFEVAD